MAEKFPRPLSANERAALDHLLSADFPGVEELRLQAKPVRVVGRCGCGCPTIELSVDEAQPSLDEVTPRVVATAETTDADRTGCTHLMLWVNDTDDGRRLLSGVELSWLEGPPKEFPAVELWKLPTPEAFGVSP